MGNFFILLCLFLFLIGLICLLIEYIIDVFDLCKHNWVLNLTTLDSKVFYCTKCFKLKKIKL
jgi:TM2 domain-containing membrane protein YozV